MSDDRAFIDRLAHAFTSGGGPAGDACPAPDTLWAARRGESPKDTRHRIVAHLAVCADCAADWALMERADDLVEETGARPEGDAPARPRRSTPRPLPWLLAAAAALVAVVAIARFTGTGGTAPAPATLRSAAGIEIASRLADGGALPRRGAVLRWSDLGDGARYTVDVATEDLQGLALARGLSRPEYTVPDAALAGLPSGAVVVWRVEAVLPDGRRIASQGFRARIE